MKIADFRTVDDVAAFYGVSGRAVRYWVAEGKVPAVDVLGRTVIRRADLLALARAGMTATMNTPPVPSQTLRRL